MGKRFEDYMRDEDQPWLPRVEVGPPVSDTDAGWRDGIAWAMGLDDRALFVAGQVDYMPDTGEHVDGQEFVPMLWDEHGDHFKGLAFETENGQWWHQYPIALRYADRDEDEEFTELEASPDHARAFWRSVGAQSEEPSTYYVKGFSEGVELVHQIAETPYMGRRDQDDRSWIASLYRFQRDRPALLDIATRMPERMREEFFDTLVMYVAGWSTASSYTMFRPPLGMYRCSKVGNVLATILGRDRVRFIDGGIEGINRPRASA